MEILPQCMEILPGNFPAGSTSEFLPMRCSAALQLSEFLYEITIRYAYSPLHLYLSPGKQKPHHDTAEFFSSTPSIIFYSEEKAAFPFHHKALQSFLLASLYP